jgi:hypothetical protein
MITIECLTSCNIKILLIIINIQNLKYVNFKSEEIEMLLSTHSDRAVPVSERNPSKGYRTIYAPRSPLAIEETNLTLR